MCLEQQNRDNMSLTQSLAELGVHSPAHKDYLNKIQVVTDNLLHHPSTYQR